MKKEVTIKGDDLDMFIKAGVKTIVMGNTKYYIGKKKKTKKTVVKSNKTK